MKSIFVRLDEQGNLQIADELDTVTRISESNRTATSSGVKIVFSDGNGPRQTPYYFSPTSRMAHFSVVDFGLPSQVRSGQQSYKECLIFPAWRVFCPRAGAFTE